jgi:hypothetical protein
MATIKIRWYVPELSNVMTQYDQVKVYRSDLEDGTYVEITGIGTRVDLVVDQTNYEYIDAAAPTPLYWYKTAYFNSTTLAESSMSDALQGSDPGLYVSLQDIRDEGFSEDDLSSERAIFLSMGWQDWFEHHTGLWFHPRELELLLDGNGSRVMWLSVPIIELTEVYINDDFTNALSTDEYTVYNRYFPEDDRKNPRVKLKRSTGDIFSGSSNQVFQTGDQNQKLVGTFGFVEEDGSVPFAVKRAIMTLIAVTASNMADGDIDAMRRGLVTEEVTDRHRIAFTDLADEIGVWSPTGWREVDMALQMYRRPASIKMARSWAV